MNFGLKKVYFLFLVRNPKSSARLKSLMALFRNPACLASSLDISEKISATAQAPRSVGSSAHKPPGQQIAEVTLLARYWPPVKRTEAENYLWSEDINL